MKSTLIFLLLLPLLPLAAEKHSPAVKAQLKAASKAAEKGDLSEQRRLLELALQDEPQSAAILSQLAGIARQECRWADGLLLLDRARALMPGGRLGIEDRREWNFLAMSRLNASPGLYCGAVKLMSPPMPTQSTRPIGPCRTHPAVLWLEVNPEGVPEKVIPMPDADIRPCESEWIAAVSRWRFRPVIAGGKPVRVAFRLSLDR